MIYLQIASSVSSDSKASYPIASALYILVQNSLIPCKIGKSHHQLFCQKTFLPQIKYLCPETAHSVKKCCITAYNSMFSRYRNGLLQPFSKSSSIINTSLEGEPLSSGFISSQSLNRNCLPSAERNCTDVLSPVLCLCAIL